jgi:phage host-nuclease inhibitor protein Gam
METSIQLAAAGKITNEQLQEQLQTALATAVETATETSIQLAAAKGITTEQIQEQVQTAMASALETAMEMSLRLTSDTGISSNEVAAELIKAQVRLEEKMNAKIALHAKGKFPLKHSLMSSTLIARMIEGPPRYDQQNGLFNLDATAASTPKFNRPFSTKHAAALSYTPRMNIMNVIFGDDFLTDATKYLFDKNKRTRDKVLQGIQRMRATVNKNARLPGGRAMDTFMQSKLGAPFMQFIDAFDGISDVLSIICTFTDGFFYDPNGTGLSWEPWAPETFENTRQKMIDAQLEAIRDYNNFIGEDDYDYPFSTAQYPIIVGPLEVTERIETLGKYRGDVEYIQRKIETEIDVIREKILRDTTPGVNRYYHDKLLSAVPDFENDEEIMRGVYDQNGVFSDDKLVYYLDYLEKAPGGCQDYDNLYRIAFTRVCDYADGQVYEDEYNGKMCGTYTRKRFQCGFKTLDECKTQAARYIASNGQVGTYGEWFNMSLLKDKNGTRIVPKDFISGGPEACIVTGQGMRSLCKQATFSDNYYDFENHTCKFTEELCQSFGTCVNERTNADGTKQTFCEIPRALQGAQMFFGQQLPREWVKVHGCHIAKPEDTDQNLIAMADFFTFGGQSFFNDMAKNQANWNAGMKHMFMGADALNTWMNIATIIGPMIAAQLGVAPGPLMIAILIVVGAQMADSALKENRAVSQNTPKEAAEYTVGGWETTELYSDVFSLETLTRTSATTTYAHGIIVPANSTVKVRLLSIKWTDGTTNTTVSALDVYVTAVPTLNSLTFNEMSVTYPGFTGFVDKKGYVKVINPNPSFKINSVSGRKIPQPVGYVDGWLTKPLRPRNSSNQIVPVTAGVSAIDGVIEKHFFADCQMNNTAYPDGQSCPGALADIAQIWRDIYTLIDDLNDWDFSRLRAELNAQAAEISASYETLRASTQDRLKAVTDQKGALESACRGSGVLTASCWNKIGAITGGSIEAAFSNLGDQISELEGVLEMINNAQISGTIQLFTQLGNRTKALVTRGAAIQLKNLASTDWSGRCVDTRIEQNFLIGRAIGEFVSGKLVRQLTREVLDSIPALPEDVKDDIMDVQYWGMTFASGGVPEWRCNTTGKINIDVSAWNDECYKAVAVDSATGTIKASKGNPVNLHVDWDDWMDAEAYKRMCSEHMSSGVPTPMIRAWSASLANKMWCIPSQPNETWADPTIGILEPLATQYAVNRAWTNFGDGPEWFSIDYPQYPDGVLYHPPQETQERDSAKHWWYQLVYSKDEFNRANLWDDAKLMEHFTKDTISQMRIEYCTDDLLGNENRGIQPLDPENIDDRCWGFLSVKISGYSYMPMAILSKVTQAIA